MLKIKINNKKLYVHIVMNILMNMNLIVFFVVIY